MKANIPPISVSVFTLKSDWLQGDSIPMTVSVKNNSEKPLVLPITLDLGYEKSPNRNIYFQIKDSTGHFLGGTDEISDYARISVLSHEQRKKTYDQGRSIETKINLSEWYKLKKGKYQLRIAFQPEESETDIPFENFPIYSDWLSISID
jgi:hypothetical protein